MTELDKTYLLRIDIFEFQYLRSVVEPKLSPSLVFLFFKGGGANT